jgi:acyl-CoA thioesterase-1
MTRTQLSRNLAIIFFIFGFLVSRESHAAAPTPRIILFLGDSITAGLGLDPAEAFPALIQKKIDARRWSFQVINAGQSGDTSAGGLGRLDWLLKNRVDVLVLELGANDGLRGLPVETTRKNLQAIIERTKHKYPEVKVILAGMKVPLIPFILEGVGGVRELNLADGIHPTAKGQEIVAANVWKVLDPILQPLAAKQK